MSSMERYDSYAPTQAPMNSRARPGLLEEIEICHKEISLLYDGIQALADKLGPICEPLITESKGSGSGPMPPPVEMAQAVQEINRLRDRISALNLAVRTLLPRIAL